jgi:hypothetical protein
MPMCRLITLAGLAPSKARQSGRSPKRWRSLLLLPIAATLACGFSVAAAPAPGAVANRARHPDHVTSAVNRTGRVSQHVPSGLSATAPGARWAIPLLTPDPAGLRQAKAAAARRVSSGGGASPQSISPLPHAAVFEGLNKAGMSAEQFGGNITPPDTTGAIGPSNYLEFVNGTGITVYDRELNPVSGPVAPWDFIQIGVPPYGFDPQIQWDEHWGRWIYVLGTFPFGPTAFGWSKTADPTNLSTEPGGGWCLYLVDTEGTFDDYPKLGHSDSGITIGTNVFNFGGEFVGARLWSISKPANPAVCPEPESGTESPELTVGAFGPGLETEDGDLASTPVPANTADSSANSYVVAADDPFLSGDAQIMGWHISGAGAGATLVADGNMEVGSFSVPANVPQPGTSEVIDSLDGRLTNAVAVTDPDVGEEAVWTQHTVDGPGGRSVVRWYELLPATQTVRQEGTISYASQFVFNGAISPTAQGNAAAIDFNRGSETLFPDMHARSRKSGTPLGEMVGDVLLGTSAGHAVDFSCGHAGRPCRWGDYAGASPDPVEPGVVWGSSQGLAAPVGDDARWTTRNFALLTSVVLAAPTITATDPASPANDNNPKVQGSAEPGSTVRIYKSSNCSGPVAAEGSAAAFESPGLAVTVADDQTTQLSATATDAAENTSPCSPPFAYTEDSTAPAAPTITATDPASPANNNNPKVKGSAEAGSTVRIYESSICSGPVAAEGSAAEFESPGLTVTVTDDQTTQLTATATDPVGNASPCSAPSTYTEDSTAPAAPTITATDPASPANDNEPKVQGTAETGSTVRIYKSSDCSGPVVAKGSAAAFQSPGLPIAVTHNQTTQFSATATDAAKNTSPCSTPFAYTEDSIIPAKPTITATDPASPANNNNPKVKGSAEAGSTVRIYESGICSGPVAAQGSAAAFESPGINVTVADNQLTYLSATATDAAKNTSPCSDPFEYTGSTPSERGSGGGAKAGIAVAKKVALVKGGKAFLKLRCRGAGACHGSLRLIARVKTAKGKRAKHSKKRARSLVIGRAGFAIPAGRTKTIRVRLTSKGRVLVRKAGRRGRKVKVRGNSVSYRTLRLRNARKHKRKGTAKPRVEPDIPDPAGRRSVLAELACEWVGLGAWTGSVRGI